jgi:diguanylate cyclase
MAQEPSSLSVLVIDDDCADRIRVSRILRRSQFPFHIVECDTPETAIQHLRAQDFDCILMDYALGPINCFDLLRQVGRDNFKFSSVVIVTGNGSEKLATDALRRGVGDYLSKSSLTSFSLIRAILESHRRSEADQALRDSAHIEDLTGLATRRLLGDRLRQAIARTNRDDRAACLVFIDLDNFKPINDTWGHAAGDAVLVEIAARLKQAIRDTDTAARVGGDEFVLLYTDLTAPADCILLIDRLRDQIALPIRLPDGNEIHVTASIGVNMIHDNTLDADTILRQADHSMYHAKNTGRDRVCYFDAEAERRITVDHVRREEVLAALRYDQFVPYYQPKIRLCDLSLAGFEALLRWHHPTRGLLSPGEFQFALEQDSLSIAIGEWVLRKAIGQLELWQAQGFNTSVSVNISPAQFQRRGFVQKIKDLLDAAPTVSGRQLEIEILESAAIKDLDAMQSVIDNCHALGVSIALDDYGTGYSSLACLRNLTIDTLKIDRSFVINMHTNSIDKAIVSAVVSLSGVFGRPVLAEGVETDSHIHSLIQMGCTYGQGFGIGRPMPAANVLPWVNVELPQLRARIFRHIPSPGTFLPANAPLQ